MINILINGSNGKMGTILKRCISNISDITLKYEIDKNTSMSFEKLNFNFSKPDVIIDFSTPQASMIALNYAVCNLVPIVIATTGFNDSEKHMIKDFSQAIPIFKASNMSYSICLIGKILKYISPMLYNMDIEILEKHHRSKPDSPSGTALFLADQINYSFENSYEYVFERHLKRSPRTNHEIGFSSIRARKFSRRAFCIFYK